MIKAYSPAERLRQLREKLVDRRREIVELALTQSPRDTNITLEVGVRAFQEVQEQIDALDSAIEDENGLETAVYESRGLLGS